MLFSGDYSSRKRVALGGRSSKERDRQVLLEEARLQRSQRSEFRRRTAAAIKIQKCFRGRRAAELARSEVRKQFYLTYGDHCQNVNKQCFSSDSEFIPHLLFFFTASNTGDVSILVEACRLLLHFAQLSGSIISLFPSTNCCENQSVVDHRVKKLVYICLKAVHQNRDQLMAQLLMPCKYSTIPAVILLETASTLANPDLPWACKVVEYLLQRNIFSMLRGILLTALHNATSQEGCSSISSFERVLVLIASHTAHHPCSCSVVDLQWSFSSQLLSVPFLWRHLPYFREVFFSKGLVKTYIHQMASYLPNLVDVLPSESKILPGYACLLGNLLEAARVALSEPNCSFLTAMDFVTVSTSLLDSLPPFPATAERYVMIENDMDEDPKEGLDIDLEKQITNAIDSNLIQNLVNAVFRSEPLVTYSDVKGQSSENEEAVSAICAFLHVTFGALRVERIVIGLAYRTELVSALWNFIKRCHENQRWPVFKFTASLPGDASGWLLPLAVFCPVYKHMLMTVDSEEFYEQHKPLSIKDIKLLVVILKQALWQLLWTIPQSIPVSQRSNSKSSAYVKLAVEAIKDRARIVISELLSLLQDWNNRRPFTAATDFHAQEATSETFISQALLENTKASEILKQAPFLVPFTSRVKIFSSHLASSRQRVGAHPAFTRHLFKIRRNHILEDAFNQMSKLSEEDLRGSLRVSFVNEFGVEEAGIDGGGIFKDFMEKITQVAFDVQYGLFKETVDHLLYPNPGSGLVYEQHLQFFEFLGSILAKAMYDGILVDIPFATFFLSKLKQKRNYLHDLPSLDPELYHHLLFLKRYKGDVSDLELYFVIVNNEYGEHAEEELKPGGKNIRVTRDNVFDYIYSVANYRLNYQIQQQSARFMAGFQKLIEKEWIEMFNENEIQLLISGSVESLDVDDLRSNAHYSGGYSADHPVIEMFWEILKSFSLEHQKKFLKFVTGCSRGPLLGFKYLEPKFCIQRTASLHLTDADLDRLPTSATCMNLLKLPPYKSKAQMQLKLMYAINADAGFDLS